MEEQGYYTPTIDEFCVGFEYEISEVYGNWLRWCKYAIKAQTLDNLDFYHYLGVKELATIYGFSKRDLELNRIRVKYLDQQDIENEGFILKHKSVDLWFETPEERDFDKINYRLESGHHVDKWKLQYGLHDHKMKIIADFITNEDVFFEGYIKNLHEFRRLLKQLNIK
jgi:hypothetical protein